MFTPAPFSPDPSTNLTYKEQLGRYLAKSYDHYFENAVFHGVTLDKHGKPVETVVRPDAGREGAYLCTYHKTTGFPNVPCECIEQMLTLMNPAAWRTDRSRSLPRRPRWCRWIRDYGCQTASSSRSRAWSASSLRTRPTARSTR